MIRSVNFLALFLSTKNDIEKVKVKYLVTFEKKINSTIEKGRKPVEKQFAENKTAESTLISKMISRIDDSVIQNTVEKAAKRLGRHTSELIVFDQQCCCFFVMTSKISIK